MSRNARKRNEPLIKPVKSIEVTDKHRKPKLILVVVLLALGVTLIVTAVSQFLTMQPGWQTIQVDGSPGEHCGGDFSLLYLLGDSGKAANVEQREIKSIYTQATKDAFQIFHEEKLFEGVNNVAYLNQHPNEAVQVPAILYEAFEVLGKYENRGIYLAPIYREYIGMFLSAGDWVAQDYDPDKNAQQDAYFTELLAFIRDESAIRLELLADSKVILHISQEYLAYAQEQQITSFIDFYWMKNAFIADYLAQQLTDAGFTKGTISSFDGFTRNLDASERAYSVNIFDRKDRDIYLAGVMVNTRAIASVALRNYPMSDLAVQLYHGWSDGSYTSCHIDPADGRSKSAINDLMGYTNTLNCAEILMQMYPVYVSDTLDAVVLQSLPAKGVETVYCDGYVIITSDSGAQISQLYQKGEVRYTWQKSE